jgi:hypothetical protein
MLQKQNRLQVPKLVWAQYKLDPSEIFKVTVSVSAGMTVVSESFFAKMYKSGRIRVPDLILALLKRDEPGLEDKLWSYV